MNDGRIAIAVLEPEIPGNAGAIARVCAATGAPLHFIGRLGFSFRHPAAQRSGMDYWEQVELTRHIAWEDFRESTSGRRVLAFTTKGRQTLWNVTFEVGDVLLFGPESRGLPDAILTELAANTVRIPMMPDARSLNLATSAAVALYEALRQTGGMKSLP